MLQNRELKKDFEDEGGFDIGGFVSKIRHFWYLFLISIIACIALAYLYTRYATPAYQINSEILVEDQSTSPGTKGLGSSAMMDFSDLLGSPSNAYNEMDILRSKSLMTNVVKEMHLNITIYKKGKIKSDELYDEAPFNVVVIVKRDSISPKAYNIKIENDKIHIASKLGLLHISKTQNENLDKTISFGETIRLEQFDFIITRKPGKIDPEGYEITFQSIDSKVSELTKRFGVDLTDKKSTTLALSFEYPNSKKGEAILQKLMTLYLLYNVENKKETADSTLAFIDDRLKIVSNQLTGVETKFTEFKKQNNIANVDEQAKALVGNVSDYNGKVNEREVQLSVLDDISKQVNDPANKRIIPSSLAVQDPVFAAAIGAYNQLVVQRDQLTLSYKETNPVIKNLDAEVEMARQSLLKSFNSYRNSLTVGLNALKTQNNALGKEVKNVPQKERVFLDYTRQQNLKEELYLYLLQKREETAISRTSSLSTARIIDPAKSDFSPYKPNKMYILLIGLFCGLTIPIVSIFLKESLNTKLLNKDDILKNTSTTVIGEIGNNTDNNKPLAVYQNSRTYLSEQFRALRTNLQFILNNDQSSVILVTSSMGNEGKSFITLNLASVLALGGKKVLMIELDLRKPKLSSYAGMEHSQGFTSYAISNSLTYADIIKPSEFSENVYILPAGPIPPNPAELLLGHRLEELVNELRTKFDYIVIDSAPVGLVSDAQLIEKHADVCLYVVRQKYTFKSQLSILNNLVSEKKFRRAYLVINDIDQNKGGYYGYGNGQEYGHYQEENK
jgi:capsular exopolysaccharide synthesis family protein